MNVAELMTQQPLTVTPTTSIGDARALAAQRRVRHIPVVDGERLAGILCVCDLDRGSAMNWVSTVMRENVVTVEPETLAVEAALTMRLKSVGCLPVVAEGRLVGILSRGDLHRAGAISRFAIGSRVCTCCRSHHSVVSIEDREPYFCRECLEHSRRSGEDDDLEIGAGD